ncbi:MAG: HDOD domain-containing protein [Planctomycetaceae bacterium]|nr:HDOD domain-containing protein [Planctomycetaceae bacterium]
MSLATATHISIDPAIVDVKELVLKRAADFTMIPAAAMKAMQVGRNPACSFKEYTVAIERDVRLTADILSMANTSLYSAGTPVTTLLDAVRRLGLVKCQELILATCTAGLMKQLPFKHARLREQLWKQGYLTAVVCMQLNQSLRMGFNGEEFTAGLMHDLGRSLLAATAPDLYAQIIKEIGPDIHRTLDVERAILGTDHCEIGGEFGRRNELPPQLVSVIQHHHAPQHDGEYSTLTTLVALAAQISSRLEADQPAVDEESETMPSSSLVTDMAKLRDVVSTMTREFTARTYAEANKLMT